MSIIKVSGQTNESQGLSTPKNDKLGVVYDGTLGYGSRASVTLDSTYVAYKMVCRVTHDLGNRLFKTPPPSVLADKYDNTTGTIQGLQFPSNISPWNAGGLYWSDNAGNQLHFRRISILSSNYISFVYTIRYLGAGSVTITSLPNGNISWKVINANATESFGGYGGGGGTSAKSFYLDALYYDHNGNPTDASGNPLDNITVYTATVAYTLNGGAGGVDNLWQGEPTYSMGDSR